MQGAGCRVQGAGCRVQCSGFRVEDSESRVEGSGVGDQALLSEGGNIAVPGAGEGREHHPVQILGGNVTTFAPHQALCQDKMTFHETSVVHRVGRVLGEGGDVAVPGAEEGPEEQPILLEALRWTIP